MNFGGTAQTKRTQMVDRMALRFSKTDPGKCKFEGEGANRVGKYVVTGTGAFRDGGWDLECERVYTPNASALPPAPAAQLVAPRRTRAFAGAGPALSPRQPRGLRAEEGRLGRGAAGRRGGGGRRAEGRAARRRVRRAQASTSGRRSSCMYGSRARAATR